MNSFFQLFSINFKILYRNWRGMFWTIGLPVVLYIALAILKINIGGFLPKKVSYATYLLPGIIAFTLLQTGMFGLAYWMIDLREKGILKRFQVTPISNSQLIGALISTRLVVMLVQVILLTGIGEIFFGTHLYGSSLVILLLLILGGSSFLCIGFLISTMAHSYEEASPMTTIVNIIFTFLGNVFFPTAILPHGLREIGAVLPMTYLAQGLRVNYLPNGTVRAALPDIIALLIWAIVLFFLAWASYRKIQES